MFSRAKSKEAALAQSVVALDPEALWRLSQVRGGPPFLEMPMLNPYEAYVMSDDNTWYLHVKTTAYVEYQQPIGQIGEQAHSVITTMVDRLCDAGMDCLTEEDYAGAFQFGQLIYTWGGTIKNPRMQVFGIQQMRRQAKEKSLDLQLYLLANDIDRTDMDESIGRLLDALLRDVKRRV